MTGDDVITDRRTDKLCVTADVHSADARRRLPTWDEIRTCQLLSSMKTNYVYVHRFSFLCSVKKSYCLSTFIMLYLSFFKGEILTVYIYHVSFHYSMKARYRLCWSRSNHKGTSWTFCPSTFDIISSICWGMWSSSLHILRVSKSRIWHLKQF